MMRLAEQVSGSSKKWALTAFTAHQLSPRLLLLAAVTHVIARTYHGDFAAAEKHPTISFSRQQARARDAANSSSKAQPAFPPPPGFVAASESVDAGLPEYVRPVPVRDYRAEAREVLLNNTCNSGGRLAVLLL